MEEGTVRKNCFICFAIIENNNSKTFYLANKVVENSLKFLHSSVADQCSESNESNNQNYCNKCFDYAEKLTELEHKVTRHQQQLKNLQKEISDSSIAFTLSVLHRRRQTNSGEDENRKSKQILELDVTGLSEIFSKTTRNVKIEKSGEIQTADGFVDSKSSKKIIEVDLTGLSPHSLSIQDSQSVSDQTSQGDDRKQMPLHDDQNVHNRENVMKKSMAEERGGVHKKYTEQQVERENCVIHDLSCRGKPNDNLSMDCDDVDNEGQGAQPNKVGVEVEPVVSAEGQQSSNVVMEEHQARNARSIKLNSLDPVTVMSKELAQINRDLLMIHNNARSVKFNSLNPLTVQSKKVVIVDRGLFKCQICEKKFTLLKELKLHERVCRVCTGKVSDKEMKNQPKLPKYRTQPQTSTQLKQVQFDLKKTNVSKARDPNEVMPKTFKCDVCTKLFVSPKHLLSHKKQHIDTDKQKKQYSSPDALRRPLPSSNLGMGLKCSTCNRNFEQLDDLFSHTCCPGASRKRRPTV